jgi:hypothetical protein
MMSSSVNTSGRSTRPLIISRQSEGGIDGRAAMVALEAQPVGRDDAVESRAAA